MRECKYERKEINKKKKKRERIFTSVSWHDRFRERDHPAEKRIEKEEMADEMN